MVAADGEPPRRADRDAAMAEGPVSALSLALTFDGHTVRMAGTPDRPEWVARDICHLLRIHNSRDAVSKEVPADEKGVAIFYTPGGPQEMATVTEAGLYRLILRSRKPQAERFRTWMVRDVIPSIRQHGCYPPPTTIVPSTREHQIAVALLLAQEVITEKDQLIAELTPKAAAHDRLQAADGTVSLMTAGRILGRKPRLLIRTLAADGILARAERGRLMPTAQYREQGFFVVREILVDLGSGDVDDSKRGVPQTLVTTRGLQWLAGRYPATDGAGKSRGREGATPSSSPAVGGGRPSRALQPAGSPEPAAEPSCLDFSPRKRETEH